MEKLGVSERTASNYAKTGTIKAEKRINPTSNQEVWMFDPDEVDLYKKQRDQPKPALPKFDKVADEQGAQRPAMQALPAPDPAPDNIVKYVIPAELPWITLHEASAITGLPLSILVDLALAGKLKGFRVAARANADRWIVRRIDVLAIQPPA
jgi:hypothetical protein